MPIRASSLASQLVLVSWVLPDRISSPITRIAALSLFSNMSACCPRVALASRGFRAYFTGMYETYDDIDAEDAMVPIWGPEGFEGMRRAGRLAAETLDYIAPFVKPGVTTEELDNRCNEFILSRGAVSACIGYRGYPKYTCISINHVVCHGIPGERV